MSIDTYYVVETTVSEKYNKQKLSLLSRQPLVKGERLIRSEEAGLLLYFLALQYYNNLKQLAFVLRPGTCLVSLSGRCGTDRFTDRYSPWLSITWIATLEGRKCSCQTEARAKIAGMAFTTKPDWN